jgi:hypothetical protein
MRTVLCIAATLLLSAQVCAEQTEDAEWIELFNGKDFAGWETSLGVPTDGSEPIGVGRDSNGVFRVVQEDGGPAIRISGETIGGLTTLKEFDNYHLQLEFKWGERRYASRAELPRDSGLLYHGVNGYGPAGWIESLEFGILEEGETGDFWSVPGQHGPRVMVDIEGEDIPKDQRRYDDQPIKFRPGGTKYVGTMLGLLNSDDNEKPRGQWNTLDLYCLGSTSVHVVNGTVNLVLHNARRRIDGREAPLDRGRLQLQSEFAEVYYRNLRLQPIKEFPAPIREAMVGAPPNTLSDQERAEGWQLLFDGDTMQGWRGYQQDTVPDGWQALNGAITCVAKAKDLITTETFDDFELQIDWKISHGGNSGIFYRATEVPERIYQHCPEYEIRDNAFWLDDPYICAACYALYPPSTSAARPVGYWNNGRIVVRGNHVEHWLNGQQVVQYEINSADWKERVKQSKYHQQHPEYGQAKRGHIGVQDYGDYVWYRNVKIRQLKNE